jgi:hypothetical protein
MGGSFSIPNLNISQDNYKKKKGSKKTESTYQPILKQLEEELTEDYHSERNKSKLALADITEEIEDKSAINLNTIFEGNKHFAVPSTPEGKKIEQRYSSIQNIRKTGRPSTISGFLQSNNKMLTTTKQYSSLDDFLNDLFSNDFVNLTNEVKQQNQKFISN